MPQVFYYIAMKYSWNYKKHGQNIIYIDLDIYFFVSYCDASLLQPIKDIELLTKVTWSEKAAPTFIIPKKKQTVWVIADFQGLNKCSKRNPYPMPYILNIFCGVEYFQWQ